jgi:hypothetical protein
MAGTIADNFVATKDGKLKPAFGVQLNHSPLDDMKFSNSGMNLAGNMHLIGGQFPTCNAEIFNISGAGMNNV